MQSPAFLLSGQGVWPAGYGFERQFWNCLRWGKSLPVFEGVRAWRSCPLLENGGVEVSRVRSQVEVVMCSFDFTEWVLVTFASIGLTSIMNWGALL